MAGTRIDLTTAIAMAAIVGAAAFAAGRSTGSSSSTTITAATPAPDTATAEPAAAAPPALPPGHAATEDLPPGHPPVGAGMGAPPMGSMGAAGGGMGMDEPAAESSLAWKVPSRWKVAPNTSSMRLATYQIPRAASDSADAEMSVMQAGGSVDANVTRWIGQFDAEGQKKAKRSTKKFGDLSVTIVEVDGTYAGGMMGGGDEGKSGWALLGAIVETPGMPHFFKMTGPEKTVHAARAELDELLSSLSTKK